MFIFVKFVYLTIAVGTFRYFYEETIFYKNMKNSESVSKIINFSNIIEIIAAIIVSLFWPMFWAYKITEILDKNNI
jgi:hypothetical protein